MKQEDEKNEKNEKKIFRNENKIYNSKNVRFLFYCTMDCIIVEVRRAELIQFPHSSAKDITTLQQQIIRNKLKGELHLCKIMKNKM